jgi:B12-binding domain/radical SAM domain protein
MPPEGASPAVRPDAGQRGSGPGRVRFTFLSDRANRTAVASLIAALELEHSPVSEIVREVRAEEAWKLEFSPDWQEVLCVTLATDNLESLARTAGRIKARSKGRVVTVAGGPHPTAEPETCLDRGFDYCCAGEGETVIREICRRLSRGHDPGGVAGLWSREWGAPGLERAPAIDLEAYPALPMTYRRPTYIEVARGCRWGCAFCQTPRIFGSAERYRSPRSVEATAAAYRTMNDIRLLAPNALAYGSQPPGRPEAGMLEEMLGRVSAACPESKLYFGSFPSETRPDYFDREALRVLRRYVSNRTLVIGGQSGSDGMLERIGRGHTVEAIISAVEMAREAGFEPAVDLILGFPGETPEDRRLTLGLVEALDRAGARTSMHFFTPLPGTPLAGSRPELLGENERGRLERLARTGIVRGRWKQQEERARRWLEG